MPFMMLILFVLFPVCFAGLSVKTAEAGAIARSCSELIVFEGGNVNNYVKQFEGLTDTYIPLGQAGKMLSLLVQLDGLYSQIGYGPLGYIYIQTDNDSPATCANDLIFKRIAGEACCSDGELQEGRGATLLSGYFESVEGQIYLLTNVAFLRKGVDETARIHSGVSQGNQNHFMLRLPGTSVSFTPRKFTEQQLYQAATAYSDVMYVRESPNADAKMYEIDPFDIEEFSYYVEEVGQGWIKIRSFRAGFPSGWVKVPEDIAGLGLRELLPELYFMDAAALYLQIRISGYGFSPERYKKYTEKFESLLDAFERRAGGASDLHALGLLKSMHVMIMLEDPGLTPTEEGIGKVSKAAAEAAELLPTSSEARSTASLTRLAASIRVEDKSFSSAGPALERDLLEVLSRDPENVYIKANLEKLWRLRSNIDEKYHPTEKLLSLRERFLKDARVQNLLNR